MNKTDDNNDVRAVHEVFESWYRAMEDGDVGGLLSLVTPDVIVKPPGVVPVEGKDALEMALGAFFESSSETVFFEVEEVEQCGELAFARVSESATILPRSGADAMVVNGVHLTILRRQPGGEWLIARDVSSLIGAE